MKFLEKFLRFFVIRQQGARMQWQYTLMMLDGTVLFKNIKV